ncbi:hypothetical protein ABIA18_004431 [Sinorhizobium fredii]
MRSGLSGSRPSQRISQTSPNRPNRVDSHWLISEGPPIVGMCGDAFPSLQRTGSGASSDTATLESSDANASRRTGNQNIRVKNKDVQACVFPRPPVGISTTALAPFQSASFKEDPFGPFFVELSKCRKWIKRCNLTRSWRIRTTAGQCGDVGFTALLLRLARGALREVHAVSMTCEVAGDLRQPRREQMQNISEISLGVEPEARRLHRLPAPKPTNFSGACLRCLRGMARR